MDLFVFVTDCVPTAASVPIEILNNLFVHGKQHSNSSRK